MAGRDRTPELPSRETLARVELDPDLFAFMLESLAETKALPRRKRPGIIDAALLSYCEFHGIDPERQAPRQMLEMAALASRLSALLDISGQVPRGDPGSDRHLAIAEAACTARLIEKDGKPTFQLLDFLGALGRAEARRQGSSMPLPTCREPVSPP